MPYFDGQTASRKPLDGGVEISEEQYSQIRADKISGKTVILDGGNVLTLSDEKRTVYSTTDKSKKEIATNEPVPDGYTLDEPGKHCKWDGSAWIVDQTLADAERALEIHARLAQIDSESVRPLRAINAGTQTQFDTDRLAELDAEAEQLRQELASLQ